MGIHGAYPCYQEFHGVFMKLVYYPDKRLFVKPDECIELVGQQTVNEMMDLMLEKNGVGLSAIQVGINKSFFVMKCGPQTGLYINPVVTPLGESQSSAPEGCLSAPGFFQSVHRYTDVSLEHGIAGDRKTSVFNGFAARIVQHETEHCYGKMFSDHFTKAQKSAMLGHLMKLRRAGQLR